MKTLLIFSHREDGDLDRLRILGYTSILMHFSYEIEDFVESLLCKLCVINRSRVFRGVYVLMKDIGR